MSLIKRIVSNKKKSIYSVLVVGMLISLGGKFIGTGFQFISQILLARNLGPNDYGLYSVGWGYFQIMGVIATFGLDYAIIKFGSEFWDKKLEQLKSLIIKFNAISILFGGCVFILLYFVGPKFLVQIGRKDLGNVFRLFSLGIPFFVLLSVNSSATRITQNISYSALVEDIFRKGFQLLLVMVLVHLGMKLTATIQVTVISYSLATILIMIFVYRLFGRGVTSNFQDGLNFRVIIKYSLFVTGTYIASNGLLWLDRIILGFSRPPAEVGLYQAASQVTFLFSTILLAVNLSIAPIISSLFHKSDLVGLGNVYKYSTKLIIYLSIPLAVILLVNPEFVLIGLYGAEFVSGKKILIMMTFAQLINVSTGSVAQIMLMTGFERRLFQFTSLAFIVNASLNLVLIPRLGGIGAAYAFGISLGLLNIMGMISINRSFGIAPFDRGIFKGVGSFFISLILIVLIYQLNIPISMLYLLLMGLLSYGCFFGILVLTGLGKEDRDFINLLKNRLINKEREEKK